MGITANQLAFFLPHVAQARFKSRIVLTSVLIFLCQKGQVLGLFLFLKTEKIDGIFINTSLKTIK